MDLNSLFSQPYYTTLATHIFGPTGLNSFEYTFYEFYHAKSQTLIFENLNRILVEKCDKA